MKIRSLKGDIFIFYERKVLNLSSYFSIAKYDWNGYFDSYKIFSFFSSTSTFDIEAYHFVSMPGRHIETKMDLSIFFSYLILYKFSINVQFKNNKFFLLFKLFKNWIYLILFLKSQTQIQQIRFQCKIEVICPSKKY